jgi:hypothetical protein
MVWYTIEVICSTNQPAWNHFYPIKILEHGTLTIISFSQTYWIFSRAWHYQSIIRNLIDKSIKLINWYHLVLGNWWSQKNCSSIDPLYNTAAFLNSIVFGKTWGAQGANAQKICRLWSCYIESLVDFRLFIVLYCYNSIHVMYIVDCSWLNCFKNLIFVVFPGQMLISLPPSASHISIWCLNCKKVYCYQVTFVTHLRIMSEHESKVLINRWQSIRSPFFWSLIININWLIDI